MAPTELRNLGKMVGLNDGTRTLVKSIMHGEVIAALGDCRSGTSKRKLTRKVGGPPGGWR